MKPFPQQILAKIYKYCAYQERCKKEVREKLRDLGCFPNKIEEVIQHLEQENFLNEQRFAETFARGKFRIKRWGKRKIAQALYQKAVPKALIDKGLAEIDESDYRQTIQLLIEKKRAELDNLSRVQQEAKIIRYLTQKGYAWEDIYEPVKGKGTKDTP